MNLQKLTKSSFSSQYPTHPLFFPIKNTDHKTGPELLLLHQGPWRPPSWISRGDLARASCPGSSAFEMAGVEDRNDCRDIKMALTYCGYVCVIIIECLIRLELIENSKWTEFVYDLHMGGGICHWGPLVALSIIVTLFVCGLYSTLLWFPPWTSLASVIHLAVYISWLVLILNYFLKSIWLGPGYLPPGWNPVSATAHRRQLWPQSQPFFTTWHFCCSNRSCCSKYWHLLKPDHKINAISVATLLATTEVKVAWAMKCLILITTKSTQGPCAWGPMSLGHPRQTYKQDHVTIYLVMFCFNMIDICIGKNWLELQSNLPSLCSVMRINLKSYYFYCHASDILLLIVTYWSFYLFFLLLMWCDTYAIISQI